MKQYVRGFALLLAVLVFAPAGVMGANPGEHDWWLLGTVQGNRIGEAVITLRLVKDGDSAENHVSITSTNKYGQYAFSDPGQGLPPSAYKLVVYVGSDRIMEVDIDRVPRGGRVPPISIHW
ncbi:MAG: hypothetical protein R2941_05445 [Desulfobacterales bacterium]